MTDLADDLINGLVAAITNTMRMLRHGVAAQVVQMEGIDGASVVLLAKIHNCEPTISSLASAVHSDTSTVSRQVQRLSDLGLVTKQADENDRRVHTVLLTDKGLDVWKELEAKRNAWFRASLSDFSPEEVEFLTVAIDRLNEGVRRQIDRLNEGVDQQRDRLNEGVDQQRDRLNEGVDQEQSPPKS